MNAVRRILFDFDYTLADSSEGILASVNHALEREGCPPADAETVRRMIGHSLEETFGQFIDPRRTDCIARCKDWFMQYADTGEMVRQTVILPDVPQTLDRLRRSGYAMGIVSTKRRSTIADTLAVHDLGGYFRVIVGYEDVERLKPDPEGLFKALQALGGTVSDTVYVGDSLIDIQAARNAGLRIIALATGRTTYETLLAHAPDRTVRSFAELQEVLQL